MDAARLTRLRSLRVHWQSGRAWIWPLAALIVIAVGVLLLEGTASWRSLDAGLRALDFDPERALLIEAWLAGAVVGFAAALFTGRPWLSTAFATGFVGLTYVVPLGTRLAQQVPILFNLRERVAVDAIRHNQLVALGVAFLVALIAAALGNLLGREVRQDFAGRRSGTRMARSGAVLASLLVAVVLATGVDPLLRIGPQAGVYSPGPLPARKLTLAPSAIPELVPAAGQLQRLTYHSEVMGEARRFIIYLPPTYGLASAASRRYRTLYLLHGDPSAPDEWLNYGTPALFDAGFARNQIAETIVVMPDGNGHVTAATQWANRRDGRDRIEDATLELVAFIDREYRTLADRGARMIGGLSSGAYGAVNMAARHPDVFGIAMGFSGYYFARGPVFGTDRAYINANSPTAILASSPAARTVHYILTVGAADSYRGYSETFVAQLRRLGVTVDYAIVPGGHGGATYWSGLLYAVGVLRSSVCEPQFGVAQGSGDPYATPATCQKASR